MINTLKKISFAIAVIIADNVYSQNWIWAKSTTVSDISYTGLMLLRLIAKTIIIQPVVLE